ncbi:MAG: YncE family protein [Thermoleophilia bacterium]
MDAGRSGSRGRDEGRGAASLARWWLRGLPAGVLILLLVAVSGCFGYTITKETTSGVTSGGTGSGTTLGENEGDSETTSATAPESSFDRAEIERRLALSPFAYVAETDVNVGATGGAAAAERTAAFAVVDSLADTLAARPECVGNPVNVAVAPDGGLVYVTDWGNPVIHIVDAETREHVRDIDLPGVRAPDLSTMQAYAMDLNAPVPWDWAEGCSSGIAVTPDGALLLVTTRAGLMVVDTATEAVVRTLSDLHAAAVAVSFDGARAYLGTDDWPTRDPRPVLEWIELRNQGVGGGLTMIDLATWEILQERALGYVNGIAMKPDDSEVFVSDHAQKALRMVDALTLEDRGLVPLGRSFPVGLGVLPDSSKAYVVCTADTTDLYAAVARRTQPTIPSAEDYFCAVVDVATEEVLKRIPLETY